MKGMIGALVVVEQFAGDALGGRGRAGEGDSGDPAVLDQVPRPCRGRPGGEDQHVLGDPGAVGEPDRIGRDLGRLRGRLGDDAIAGGKGSADLAEEDGEREVPGGDADPGAAAPIRSTLRSPVGPGSSTGCRRFLACAA